MTAQIHDLGYEAYRGARTPPSRRFLVMARNVFAVAWRSRVGVKLPLLYAGAVTVVISVIMYLARHRLAEMARQRGAPIPRAEELIFNAFGFCELAGYVLGAVVACAAVANDLRLGAFQFYFSRPLRPRDYVLGKLLGVALVVGVPMFGTPFVLSLVRLLLADDVSQAVSLLPIVPRAALFGLLATAVFVLPPMAIGALLGKRQPAQALFVVYFVVLVSAAQMLADALRVPELALLSVGRDVDVIGRALFGVAASSRDPGPWPAAGALALICGLSFLAIWWRVSRAETAGLGSG